MPRWRDSEDNYAVRNDFIALPLYSYVWGHPRVLLYHHDGKRALVPSRYNGFWRHIGPCKTRTYNRRVQYGYINWQGVTTSLFIGRPNRLSTLSITAGKTHLTVLVTVAVTCAELTPSHLHSHDNFKTKQFDDVRCYFVIRVVGICCWGINGYSFNQVRSNLGQKLTIRKKLITRKLGLPVDWVWISGCMMQKCYTAYHTISKEFGYVKCWKLLVEGKKLCSIRLPSQYLI